MASGMDVSQGAVSTILVILSLGALPVLSLSVAHHDIMGGCMAEMWRAAGVPLYKSLEYERTMQRRGVLSVAMNFNENFLSNFLRAHGVHHLGDRQMFARCFTAQPSSDVPESCRNYRICNGNGHCMINRRRAGAPYMCSCNAGYHGLGCFQRNSCRDPDLCLNGGTCTNLQFNRYQCACPIGYTGSACQTSIQSTVSVIDYNPCLSMPCGNGGTCSRTEQGYNCSCSPYRMGARCNIFNDACMINPCRNGGSCRLTQRSPHFTCVCPPRFLGRYCEETHCSSNPCRNGGTCSYWARGYSCACRAGVLGQNCDIVTDVCLRNPCRHGGVCAPTQASPYYNCTCSTGYEGRHCQTFVDDCSSSPCGNGGVCLPHQQNYTCLCRLGFTGAQCRTEVNLCDSNPCLNGATCEGTLYRYQCSCTTGYEGSNCENMAAPAPTVSSSQVGEMMGLQRSMQGQINRLETLVNRILANQKGQMKSDGTVFYRLFLQSVTWYAAALRCRQSGGNLASVRSNQQHFMLSIVPGAKQATGGAVWLGGRRNTVRDSWRWTDGDKLGYQMWNETSPAGNNSTATGCLAFVVARNTTPEGWAARSCNSRLPFFCEYR